MSPPSILLAQPQVLGTFLRRVNRFAIEAEVEGRVVTAHLPNSGRMTELLVPGHPVVLACHDSPARKTAYDMLLVQYRGAWVSVDSRLPSALAFEALRLGAFPFWAEFPERRREVVCGESRLDLEVRGPAGRCLIETKSVNLVEDGVALFPDAPTTRGCRHLRTLMDVIDRGDRAAVLFIVQREDARCLSPFDAADPEFGRLLREAVRRGVEAYAYRCRVAPDRMVLGEPLALRL